MAAGKAVQGLKQVKPILSLNRQDARYKALKLYRAWYRYIPRLCDSYDLELTEDRCRTLLRKKFYQNKNVADIRVIDVLCIKGQLDLEECKNIWKQRNHVMALFADTDTVNPKPEGFLAKFYDGHEP